MFAKIAIRVCLNVNCRKFLKTHGFFVNTEKWGSDTPPNIKKPNNNIYVKLLLKMDSKI